MDRKIREIRKFLEDGSLPHYLVSHSQKQDFHRWAQNFILQGPNLMVARPDKTWALVVLDRKDRLQFAKLAHIPKSGVHRSLLETKKEVSDTFYWPTLYEDVTKWVKRCKCQQKSGSERSLPSQDVTEGHCVQDPLATFHIESVTPTFEQVGMRVMGPLPETQKGFQFILLWVDTYSLWVEASPLKEEKPEEVATALIPFLFRFGFPQILVTAMSPLFVYEVNLSLYEQFQSYLGMTLSKLEVIKSTINPKINNITSLTSTSIRKTLWNLLQTDENKWDLVLDEALFTLRTRVTRSRSRSPFELLYGYKARTAKDVPSHFDVAAVDIVTGDLKPSETRDPVPEPMELPDQATQ